MTTTREKFVFLADPTLRRSALANVETSIRRGWLPAEDRPALARALRSLIDSGSPTDRERVRARRILDLIATGQAG
jgi:hypothetical protein